MLGRYRLGAMVFWRGREEGGRLTFFDPGVGLINVGYLFLGMGWLCDWARGNGVGWGFGHWIRICWVVIIKGPFVY